MTQSPEAIFLILFFARKSDHIKTPRRRRGQIPQKGAHLVGKGVSFSAVIWGAAGMSHFHHEVGTFRWCENR